jgi:glycosyltransferase involved in cell wall biosynthesis
MSGTGPLRILMLTSETSWGGGETQIDLLMRGLLDNRYGVALAAPRGSRIAWRARTLDVMVHPLSISGGFDAGAAVRLRRIVKRDRYDIVHSHSSHAHSIAFLSTLALPARPRLVVSRRVAFPPATNFVSRMKYDRGADLYLAISAGVRDVLAAAGVVQRKIEIVPSGIDLEKFSTAGDRAAVRRELGLPDGAPVIGTIGALVPNKAQADLIRAAHLLVKRFPNIHLLIVGEGQLRESLQSLARDLNLGERIIFTGFREDSLALLSLCDCFVIPSMLEGLCTSIMDAQVLGIPVVASGTGGIPDLIDDGVSGLLVAPRQPDRLAAAIERMLAEPDLRSRCIIRGKAKAAAYDYRNMVKRTAAAYRRVCSRNAD